MRLGLPALVQAARYRARGQSYWVAHYRDRDPVSEWDVDWSLVPRQGLKELHLHAPNGQVGVVGGKDGSDRLFQFKIGQVGAGGHITLAQVIGYLEDTHGNATCWCWDYERRELVGPFAQDVSSGGLQLGAGATAHMAWDVLGAKPD